MKYIFTWLERVEMVVEAESPELARQALNMEYDLKAQQGERAIVSQTQMYAWTEE